MARDAAATKARLLEAAAEEFAEHGLAGARVDRIAPRAGVNKERLYNYFGSKERLFGAVLTDRLRELARALPVTPAALADVRAFAGAVYDYHRANPQLVRLLQWEALAYGDRPVPDEAERTADYSRKAAAVAEALLEQDGEPVAGDHALEAAYLLLFVLALCLWPVAMRPLTRMLTAGGSDESIRAAVVEAAARLAGAGQLADTR